MIGMGFLASKLGPTGAKIAVIAVIVAAIATAGFFAYRFVTNLQEENAQMRAAIAVHERNAQVYESAIANEKAARIRQAAEADANAQALTEYVGRLRGARQALSVLRAKLGDHALDTIAARKPRMLERRIEAGTEKLFDDWEALANSD